MTEQMKLIRFHTLLRKGALQAFRNINSINRQTLEDVLVIFRRKYVKPESEATAKHKWHRLILDPNTMKMPDFSEELNQGAEKTFGENAKSMIESLLKYAKLPPKLKRSVNMARLENGTYEEIVAHLELDLFALEESYDLPVASMPHHLLIAATYCPLVLIPARKPNVPTARQPDISTKIVRN